MSKVELLIPCGDIESFKEGLKSGADSFYLSGKSFGARKYANNFSNDELKEVIEEAHLYQKKVYITVNTLIYNDEFEKLKEFLDFIYMAGCDAVIVQDFGVFTFIKENYPLLDIHASTQMNIKTFDEARVLEKLGFKRVIMAREASISEIKKIKENLNIEVEVFVHGALCVSMSGQCLASSFAFKRSGNRGMCAGNCRLHYVLDDKEKGYLLSMKDLCTLDRLEELISSGVDSFKIEGRMKRKEYVRVVTNVYKRRIQSILNGNSYNIEDSIKNLKLMFNRGFTKGFIFNENKGNIVNSLSPNHIGVEIGKVISCYQNKIVILLTDSLCFGDSIRLKNKYKEDAITINEMIVMGKKVKEAKRGDKITLLSHSEGLFDAICYKTTSASLINDTMQMEKIHINARCFIHEGRMALSCSKGNVKVTKVISKPLDETDKDYSERIKSQILKTGNTPFIIDNIKMDIESNKYVPIADINNLRRKVLEKLENLLKIRYVERSLKEDIHLPNETSSFTSSRSDLTLKIRVNEESQFLKVYEEIEKYDFKYQIYFNDYSLYEKYKNELDDINISSFYYLERSDGNSYNDNVISSSFASIKNNIPSIYMNNVNSYTSVFLEKMGAKVLPLSPEVTKNDINSIVSNYHKMGGTLPFEMMVYGYYEIMYTSYCLLNKMGLCNKCKGVHFLKDQKGFTFPLITTKSCHMMIFNSRRLHLVDYLDEIIELGVSNILIDFTIEKEDEVTEVMKMYLKALKHIDTPKILMKKDDVYNVINGHFKEGVR